MGKRSDMAFDLLKERAEEIFWDTNVILTNWLLSRKMLRKLRSAGMVDSYYVRLPEGTIKLAWTAKPKLWSNVNGISIRKEGNTDKTAEA
jgi:hypothetical protein